MPISVESTLNSYFTRKNFQELLPTLPPPQTPVQDILFPTAKRQQKASATITYGEVEDATGAIPVVQRGAQSYPINAGQKSLETFEPTGFRPSIFVSAKEMNDALSTGIIQNVNDFLREKTEMLRRRIIASTEILCCQAMTGTIKYPAVTAAGLDEYTVNLGEPKTVSAVDISGKTLGDLQKMLEEHYTAQVKTGAMRNVCFFAGTEVYSAIVDLIINAQGQVPVQWLSDGSGGFILFGKYRIMPAIFDYMLPGQSKLVSVIDAKSMKTVDLTNTGILFYMALDDFAANLAPLPFFAKQVKSDDPSGYKIIGMSKPLPAFAVKKTVDRKYLA